METQRVNTMSFGDTCQASSDIPSTSCVIQRWHFAVCKVDQHLRERLASCAAVTPVIGPER